MKFSIASVGLLCMLGDGAAFVPHSRNIFGITTVPRLEVSPLAPVQLQGLSSPNNEDCDLISLPSLVTNQVVSVIAATVISAATLGLTVAPPEPAFAVPVARAETVAKTSTKIPAEVAAVDAAKKQLAAATQSFLDYQKAVPLSKAAERDAIKAVTVAENQLTTSKKNLAAANERLKSLTTSSAKFDKKTLSTAETRVVETTESVKQAQSRYNAAKVASDKAKKDAVDAEKGLAKSTKDKEFSEKKLKAAEEKLKEFEKRQAEARKKAEVEAKEKAKIAAQKQKEAEKKQAEKAKQDAVIKAQKEKEAAEKAQKDRKELIKKIQKQELEVKRLQKEKVRLEASPKTSNKEVSQIVKQLEAREKELANLKAMR